MELLIIDDLKNVTEALGYKFYYSSRYGINHVYPETTVEKFFFLIDPVVYNSSFLNGAVQNQATFEIFFEVMKRCDPRNPVGKESDGNFEDGQYYTCVKPLIKEFSDTFIKEFCNQNIKLEFSSMQIQPIYNRYDENYSGFLAKAGGAYY
jgi:hypothetical protein